MWSAECGVRNSNRAGGLFVVFHSALRIPNSALEMGPMERLALSWGNARQFTKLLLSLLSHIGVLNADFGIRSAECQTNTETASAHVPIPHSALITPNSEWRSECGFRNSDCEMEDSNSLRYSGLNSTFRTLHSAFELAGRHGAAPCSAV